MAYWASYVAFSFNPQQIRNILNKAKTSLANLNDYKEER